MIKNWKINLILSLVCFGIPCLIMYLSAQPANVFLLWFLFASIPIIAFIFGIMIVVGLIMLVAGIIGGIKTSEARSKSFVLIVLVLIALMLFLAGNQVIWALNNSHFH